MSMFIETSEIVVRNNGMYRGQYPQLQEVIGALDFESLQQNTEIKFDNGTLHLIDWSAMSSALDGHGRLVVPVRSLDYYSSMLGHEGLHPRIQEFVNNQLEGDPNLLVNDLADLRRDIALFEGSRNPLSRPAPLGVSINIMQTNRDDEIQMLVTKRSECVAVNPGIYTTAVDEGVHALDDQFPWSIIFRGVIGEIGPNLISEGYIRQSLRCVGFHYPEKDTVGAKAGGNMLFFLDLDHTFDLEELANAAAMTDEAEQSFVLSPIEVMKLEQHLVAPILRHSAHLLCGNSTEG